MARASIKKTGVDRTISNKKDIKMSFAMGRRIKSGVSASSTLGSGQGSGGSIDVKGHYLETAGGTMIGPIAFYPQAVAVLSDAIDISSTAGNYSTYVIANGQGAAADNLSKIIGAAFSGQELIIQAAATTPITLKDIATPGNIHLPGGLDVLIPALDAVTLIFDPTQPSGGRWILSAGSGSGGGFTNPATANLDMNGFDIILDADGNSKFNLTTDNVVILELNSVSKYIFTDIGMDLQSLFVEMNEISTPTLPGANALRFYAKDWGGVTKLTSLDSTGTETTIGSDNLGNHIATTNLQMSNFSIFGVKHIDLDDLNSKIEGIKTLEFVDSFPNIYITSGATGLGLLVPSNKSIQFFGNGFLIAKFEDVAGVLALDMDGNKIINSRELKFSLTDDAIISNTEAGMGYIDSTNRIIFNVPSGNEYNFNRNGVLGVTIAGATLTADAINTKVLQLNVTAITPAFPGEFRMDGTDVLVYSGGQVRNLSSGGGEVSDEVFKIFDDITTTKKLRFSLASFAIGESLIASTTLTAARTWILPDISSTFAMLGATQTFSGSNTFSGNVTFGDSSGDLISFIGRFNTDLLPSTNAVRDLGSASLTLDEIHGQKLFAYNRMKIPVGTNMYS